MPVALSEKICPFPQRTPGRQILTEFGDNLLNNVNASSTVTSGSSQSLSNAKSDMSSLTQRESAVASATKTQSVDFATSFANGNTQSDLISTSEAMSLKEIMTDSKATAQNTSVGDTKTTGTSSNIGVGVPSPLTAITGVSGSTNTNASNSHDLREDMSESQRQSYDSIMDKVNTAAITGNFTTNNSEDRKLGESYAANLMEQEQISSDKAKTQQDIDTYSNQVSYAQQNAGTINKNLNEPFLQEIIAKNPEINSKEQALKWSKTHQAESNDIMKSVINQNNPFETADYKAHVQKLENSNKAVENIQNASPNTLESRHNINANKVQKQATVQDVTGVQKPLKEVVTNAAKITDSGYNSNIKNMLQNNLSSEEKVIAKNLENEKNQVKDSKVDQTTTKINKEKAKLKGIVGKSTVARVFDKVGNDTSKTLGIATVNDTGNKKND